VDGNRFDAMTVALAVSGSTRRVLLRRAGMGALVTLLAAIAPGQAGTPRATARGRKAGTRLANARDKYGDWPPGPDEPCVDNPHTYCGPPWVCCDGFECVSNPPNYQFHCERIG
jgi:hypothetical protein